MTRAALDLHHWRRLDWRFLLPLPPNPHLALGGRVDADLRVAAALFDPASVDLGEAGPTSCDVVLIAAPVAADIQAARAALVPGGWLCLEATRRTRRPRTLAAWRVLLRRQGFEDIQVYWHAPTLAETSRIVPLGSPMAVRSTLARHRGLRFGRARAAVGAVVLRLGLFDRVVPEGTVVGRVPGGRS